MRENMDVLTKKILTDKLNGYLKKNILRFLITNNPSCPCSIADGISENDDILYRPFAELLSLGCIVITTYDEEYNTCSQRLMKEVRRIESVCEDEYSLTHNNEECLKKRVNLWYSFFKNLSDHNYNSSILFILTDKGLDNYKIAYNKEVKNIENISVTAL